MATVKLLQDHAREAGISDANLTHLDPHHVAKFAAGICKNPSVPKYGAPGVPVKEGLFQVSHHTTLGHPSFNFVLDDVSVGSLTLGLHLPVFNVLDQRSGRFCTEMFSSFSEESIGKRIDTYWEISSLQKARATAFFMHGVQLFNTYLPQCIEAIALHVARERPFFPKKGYADKIRGLAQEQLRVFISTFTPTAELITLGLPAIFSLWHSAHTPETRQITDLMRDEVLKLHPHLAYMFEAQEDRLKEQNWTPEILGVPALSGVPHVRFLGGSTDYRFMVDPAIEDLSPIDLLPFKPKYAPNNTLRVDSEVCISLMTMGQDQRHRTIHRDAPVFTGEFYVPPVVRECVPHDVLLNYVHEWRALFSHLPETLAVALAPYGMMVRYKKSAPLNAFIHEMMKRRCNLAQGEIRTVAKLLYPQVLNSGILGAERVARIITAPCVLTKGTCTEGKYYCGIDLRKIRRDDTSDIDSISVL